jgi:hypothetical protein
MIPTDARAVDHMRHSGGRHIYDQTTAADIVRVPDVVVYLELQRRADTSSTDLVDPFSHARPRNRVDCPCRTGDLVLYDSDDQCAAIDCERRDVLRESFPALGALG